MYEISSLLPLQVLRKMWHCFFLFFINGNFEEKKKQQNYQGRNSESYSPSALILVYTKHQPTVHVCTKFEL